MQGLRRLKSFICLIIFLSQTFLYGTGTSSLLFHVDQMISPTNNAIDFTEENVADLWVKTQEETLPEHQPIYEQAKEAYYQGQIASAYESMVDLWNAQREQLTISEEQFCKDSITDYNGFSANPRLSSKTKKRIQPFILPSNHPIKPAMDSIFLTSRVTLKLKTLKEAGFFPLFIQPRSFVIVCTHDLLPGYLVKANLDDEIRLKHHKPEWEWLTRRCEGAARIQRIIENEQIIYFNIPNKWMYPLPETPAPPKSMKYLRKEFVLLAEKMDLVPEEKNKIAWQTVITHDHLRELYKIISYAWTSSFRRDNIPYTYSGKFTFIDTEYKKEKDAPNYESIRPSLSLEMDQFWKLLIRTGGEA